MLKKRWYHKPSYIFTSIKTNQFFKNLHWWQLLNFSLLNFQLSNFISKLYLSNFNFHNSNLTFLSISNLYTCLLKKLFRLWMFFKLLTYKIDIETSIHLDGSLKITYVLSKTTLTKNKLPNICQPNCQEISCPVYWLEIINDLSSFWNRRNYNGSVWYRFITRYFNYAVYAIIYFVWYH